MKFFKNNKMLKTFLRMKKEGLVKDNGEELEKYKSFVERKKDMLIKLHLEKVELYSALHEAFIRSTRLISGADYSKDKQERDLATIEKSLFYFESKEVYEALTLMSCKVSELHRLEKKREKINPDFQKGYMEQLNKLKQLMKTDIANGVRYFSNF